MSTGLRRLISLVLIATMVFSLSCEVFAADGGVTGADPGDGAEGKVLRLPASLKVIEEEAFMGDTSLQDVEIPDGVEEIGERAFAGSSVSSIVIPDSVERIGEHAFENATNATISCYKDSAAYNYAVYHDIPVSIIGAYGIAAVWVEGMTFTAEITTEAACLLKAEILDEKNETLIASSVIACDLDMTNEDVSIVFDELPEYYIIRASLVDEYGNMFCEPFISQHYTKAYAEFEQKTPEDFPEAEILDFGSNGFGVMQNSVVIVSGSISGNSYIIKTNRSLQVGDSLYLSNTKEFIKIAAITNHRNGTYTVTPDLNASITDFYQYLRFETQIDAVHELAEAGYFAEDEVIRLMGNPKALYRKEVKISQTDGPVTGSIGGSIGLYYSNNIDVALFGYDYMEQEIYLQVDGEVTLEASAQASLKKEIPVLKVPYVPGMPPGLGLAIDITLPVRINAEAAAGTKIKFEGRGGYRYDERSGGSKISEIKFSPTIHADGKITAEVGPKFSVGLQALYIYTASVGLYLGGVVSASTTLLDKDLSKQPSEIHACDLCFDLEIKSFVDLFAELTQELPFSSEKQLFYKKFPITSKSIYEGYLSVINDVNSIHEGKVRLGSGSCPNKEYLVTIKTEDDNGAVRDNEHVNIYRVMDGWTAPVETNLLSPVYIYLSNGGYKATANILSEDCEQLFFVHDRSMEVRLHSNERHFIVSGRITDGKNVLEGVTISAGDHTTHSGADGKYELEVTEGSVEISYAKEGYLTQTKKMLVNDHCSGINITMTETTPSPEPTPTPSPEPTTTPSPEPTPTPSPVIWGVVQDGMGNPLSGVKVLVDGSVYYTDSNGWYSIQLPEGRYWIEFIKTGYIGRGWNAQSKLAEGTYYLTTLYTESEGYEIGEGAALFTEPSSHSLRCNYTASMDSNVSISIGSNALLSYYIPESELSSIHAYDCYTGNHIGTFVYDETQNMLTLNTTLRIDQRITFVLPGCSSTSVMWYISVD